MDFKAVKPVGRFNPKAPMAVIAPFAGLRPGDPVPKASYSRLRKWWRRGWIANSHELPETAPDLPPELQDSPVEAGSSQPPETVVEPRTQTEEPKPVTAEEGLAGWWEVLFDDGSTRKMRKSQVEDLGLIVDGI